MKRLISENQLIIIKLLIVIKIIKIVKVKDARLVAKT